MTALTAFYGRPELGFEASIATNANYMRFRSLPVVQDLGEPEAKLLFSCFLERNIAASTPIYSADEASNNEMYLILDGRVSVSDRSGFCYETLGPGDVFGLFSFLDEDRVHSASIQAETDLNLLLINRAYFNVLTLEHPPLGNQMLRFIFKLLSRMALKLEVEYAAMRGFALGRK